jgi:hypothetical protein
MVAVINKYAQNDDSLDEQISTYLTFVQHSFNPENNLFRNFMSYDRKWLEESGSEDCNGRIRYFADAACFRANYERGIP